MGNEVESHYPMDWLKKAKEDFDRVSKRLDENDVSDAGMHLQQALEKYLKAYLLSKGWKLQRIHDLRALLEEAIKHNNAFQSFKTLRQKVTPYYFLERYPLFMMAQITKESVEEALKDASKLVQMIVKELKCEKY